MGKNFASKILLSDVGGRGLHNLDFEQVLYIDVESPGDANDDNGRDTVLCIWQSVQIINLDRLLRNLGSLSMFLEPK